MTSDIGNAKISHLKDPSFSIILSEARPTEYHYLSKYQDLENHRVKLKETQVWFMPNKPHRKPEDSKRK